MEAAVLSHTPATEYLDMDLKLFTDLRLALSAVLKRQAEARTAAATQKKR